MRLMTNFWMCRRFRSSISGRVFKEVWATGQRKATMVRKAAEAKSLWPDKSFVVCKPFGKRAIRAFGAV